MWDYTIFGKLSVFGMGASTTSQICKVVIMLTLFGKLLLIAFCGDYAPYSNSFLGFIVRKKSEDGGISGQKTKSKIKY